MLLTELKVFGDIKTGGTWLFYRRGNLHFFKKKSDDFQHDVQKELGLDEFDKLLLGTLGMPDEEDDDNFSWNDHVAANAKDDGKDKDPTDRYGGAWALLDTKTETLNLDVTKYDASRDRRANIKVNAVTSSRDAKKAYPILGASVKEFKDTTALVKIMKELIRKKPVYAGYTVIGDDRVHGQTVSAIAANKNIPGTFNKLFDPRATEIIVYHGTSQERATDILKNGLRTGARSETYADLVQNYSASNVYLAFSPGEAANYATREAINDGSNAVILKVRIPAMKFGNLRPDEDSMHWMKETVSRSFIKQLYANNPILQAIWGNVGGPSIHFKSLDHQNKIFGLNWIYGSDRTSEFTKHATKVLKAAGLAKDSQAIKDVEKHLYVAIMKMYIEGAFKKGMKNTGTVAYKGSIPAKDIALVKSWTVRGSMVDMYPDEDEYKIALDKQAKSTNR